MNTHREYCTGAVCSMLWQSISGWMNRPDYFDTNSMKLLGDLAYLAKVDSESLFAALSGWTPTDAYELVCGLQRKGKSDRLYEYLIERDKKDMPLMCNLEEIGKWRDIERDTETPPLWDDGA